MGDYVILAISCILINNILLAQFLGNCPFLGTSKKMETAVGMAMAVVFVLVGLGLIIWFTTQNLILRARFDESERQHDLMAAKNLQLKEEIQKRQEAEEELKVQRTLRMRSDRLRSLGEMAAGIAHELNQPLVGVRGFAELVLGSIDDGLEISKDLIRSNVATIVEQARCRRVWSSRSDVARSSPSGVGYRLTTSKTRALSLARLAIASVLRQTSIRSVGVMFSCRAIRT